ncbi:hypothetical protein BV25DRAFT_1165193 [Artomyces pyxidatus]|uniref:Uncharacterized protein n=1 Tax=Artomyces pyxidatus TaxID=48021 RepID=A0ACB8SR55_9AGAM|nr:hypothetical protein BV25DRAFT_1165193 [Artomyces pyxidatus]
MLPRRAPPPLHVAGDQLSSLTARLLRRTQPVHLYRSQEETARSTILLTCFCARRRSHSTFPRAARTFISARSQAPDPSATAQGTRAGQTHCRTRREALAARRFLPQGGVGVRGRPMAKVAGASCDGGACEGARRRAVEMQPPASSQKSATTGSFELVPTTTAERIQASNAQERDGTLTRGRRHTRRAWDRRSPIALIEIISSARGSASARDGIHHRRYLGDLDPDRRRSRVRSWWWRGERARRSTSIVSNAGRRALRWICWPKAYIRSIYAAPAGGLLCRRGDPGDSACITAIVRM